MKMFDTNMIRLPVVLGVLLMLTGCGKPQSSGGPPEGMPTPAVLARVTPQTLEITLDLVAGLESADRVDLVSEVDAAVVAIEVEEGQRVAKGDLLFRLDDVQTTAALKEAEASWSLAELIHKRNERLLANHTISQQEYDEAASTLASHEAALIRAKDRHSKTKVLAPFDGRVGQKKVSVGQFMRYGDPLIELMGIDELDLVADVPERHVGAVKPGQTVSFATSAWPGRAFSGTVRYIAPYVNPETRTIRIKAKAADTEGALKPGMFGRMNLIMASKENAILIPESAVSFSSAGRTVIRVNAQGNAEFVPVTTGERKPGMVEITSGLSDGDIVVIEGGQKMGPGSLVMASAESANYGVEPGPVGTPAGETGDASD